VQLTGEGGTCASWRSVSMRSRARLGRPYLDNSWPGSDWWTGGRHVYTVCCPRHGEQRCVNLHGGRAQQPLFACTDQALMPWASAPPPRHMCWCSLLHRRRLHAGFKAIMLAHWQTRNRTGGEESQQQQDRELNARHGRWLLTASGSAGGLRAAAACDVCRRLCRKL